MIDAAVRSNSAPMPADRQAVADPLAAPAADGWSPADLRVVTTQTPPGFVRSAFQFARGQVVDRPGQRLTSAMVDELAPYFARTFGVSEADVRADLSKVYLYVGGPTSGGHMAMTVGHHIYLPGSAELKQIVSPQYKRWLVHELAHTMQFATYAGGSPYGAISQYLKGLAIGVNPRDAGTGSGPIVWGSVFTGAAAPNDPLENAGERAIAPRQRLALSMFPASAIGVPVGLALGGGIAGTRGVVARHIPELKALLPGAGNSMATGLAAVALPFAVGAIAGSAADVIGKRQAQSAGALSAGALTAGALHRLGFLRTAGHARVATLAAFAGATALGATLGLVSATATANSIEGWNLTGAALHGIRTHAENQRATKDLADAIHDAHWQETDAELIARRFMRDGNNGSAGVHARQPRADDSHRLDWSLYNPLIVGVPLAAAGGAGVAGARIGKAALNSTLRGDNLRQTLRTIATHLRSTQRGPLNSLGVGASTTLLPLVVGGAVATVADSTGRSQTFSRIAGTAVATVSAGAALTMLLGRGGKGALIARAPGVLAGTAGAAVLGFAASSVAVNAAHPAERRYLAA